MTTAEAIAEMMRNWNRAEALVRATFPGLDPEAVRVCVGMLMNESLGLPLSH